MSYNVIDDGNNQLIKVANHIIWEYRYAHKNKQCKYSLVSRTSLKLAEETLKEVGIESDKKLAEALEAIIAEGLNNPVSNGLIVTQESIARLQSCIKLAEEEDLS